MREEDRQAERQRGSVKTRAARGGWGGGAEAGEVEGCDYGVTVAAALSPFPGNYKAG